MNIKIIYLLFVQIFISTSLYAQDLNAIQKIFWNESRDEVAKVLIQNLEGKDEQYKSRRLREYWTLFKPQSFDGELANINEQLSNLVARANNQISLSGENDGAGFYVRDGHTSEEARAELLRGWIMMMDPALAQNLLRSRANSDTVTREDIINFTLFIESDNPNPNLRTKLSDLNQYVGADNPVYRLMAVEKAVQAEPDGLDLSQSETNEYGFALLKQRKNFLKQFEDDQVEIIANEAESKAKAIQNAIDGMVAQFGFEADEVEFSSVQPSSPEVTNVTSSSDTGESEMPQDRLQAPEEVEIVTDAENQPRFSWFYFGIVILGLVLAVFIGIRAFRH